MCNFEDGWNYVTSDLLGFIEKGQNMRKKI